MGFALVDNLIDSLDIKFVLNYVRKSRADSEADLEKHRMILRDLCVRNGWKYVEYLEIGTSDSIEMRPKMLRLLREVEAGYYDAVLVVDYDRLGRGDLGEQDRIKKVFQKSETLIVTPDKIYDLNNDIDDAYADFKGLCARQELKIITKRLRQGKKIGSLRGNWTNGIPPFPYVYQRYKDKFNEKGLVVNDEQFKIYRQFVEMALNRVSPKDISIYFNNKGFRTTRGCYWSGVAISRLLKDETGLGKIISNKSEGDGHRVKKPNSKSLTYFPRSEWIIIENCHEAVKTQQEHDAILQIFEERRTVAPAAKPQTHTFSGLIKCKHCGRSMTFYKRKGEILMKPCWYKDPLGNKCHNGGMKLEPIEKIILDKIMNYKDKIICESDNVNPSQQPNTLTDKKMVLEQALEQQTRALEIVNDAYELGDYGRNEWLRRKQKREQEIKKLNDEIYKISKCINQSESVTKEQRRIALVEFVNNIANLESGKAKNDLYRSIINSIIWHRDGDNINIKINFK